MVVSCAFVGRGVYVVFFSIPVLYMFCLGDPRHSDTASVALRTNRQSLGRFRRHVLGALGCEVLLLVGSPRLKNRRHSGFGLPPDHDPLADMDSLSRIWNPLKTSVVNP